MSFQIPKDKILCFDGAMGTMLQKRGLKLGDIPETLNLCAPDVIASINREYLDAGADIISANTFGANRFKAEKAGRSLDEMVTAAVEIAKEAASGYGDRYVALDIGPCGRVMKPAGDLDFEEAVEVFAEIVRAGTAAGADLILLETFTDLYELKAAILAAKENSTLPVFATMSFEENGYTFFGTSVESMIMTLEGLGVDALGVNCSLGPKQLVPVVEKILSIATIPVMVQPNAGLPVVEDSGTRYDITPDEFAQYVKQFCEAGVRIVGGCCGTSPEYIAKVKALTGSVTPRERGNERKTGVCSPKKAILFGDDVVIIGERLNPTGKKTLQAALREKNMDYLRSEAVKQQEQGAHVLDLNVGLPDIDEPKILAEATMAVQAAVDLPLQLDSSNVAALEKAARIYNGKPLINSVSGKRESLDAVLPIVKKYGAAVLGLTLDEAGIPETADERLAIARRIVEAAERHGIPREDVLIDCLVMTVSAQQSQAMQTLHALQMVKKELGVKTVLGVSNVSFGLPQRPVINRTMLAMALMSGLDAPIMNPGDAGMAEAVAAYRVLAAKDKDAAHFIAKFAHADGASIKERKEENSASLPHAIVSGLAREAQDAVKELLKTESALAIIEREIVPALDTVGRDYETGELFLPDLIKSAEAAKSAFDILRAHMPAEEKNAAAKQKIILATVHGDIHDIGKNIVKVIMENYSFDVIDLGRDVPAKTVVEAVKKENANLVGLSALMTTTVVSMEETIALLRKECPGVKVIVGGAVLTEALSRRINADLYAKDAMAGVRKLQSI